MACRAEELLDADVGDELLEHRRTLGVGDAVEVLTGGLQIDDVGDDRVRRRLLVGGVGPGLATDGEVRPGLAVLGGVDRGMGSHVLGEGLLEPQVVPPLGGDEVSEPHVSHLVEDGVRPTGKLGASGRAAVDVVLGEGHEARILHGAEVVLGHEDLVVLAPRVGVAEGVVVEGQALLGDLEDLLMVHVLGQGCASENAQRDGLRAVAGVPFVLESDVRASGDGGEVGRHPRGEGEVVQDAAFLLAGVLMDLVGDDAPSLRCEDIEVDVGLEVGLLEDRVHTSGISGLEVGVEVHLAVGRVDEAVQTLAGVLIGQLGGDDDEILAVGAQSVQLNTGAVVFRIDLLVIDDHRLDLGVEQVQEGVGLLGGET